MGTHVYIFSQSDIIPTLRELFDLAAGRGYRLKLNPDMFDDDEEEQEFLDEYRDSSDWREVSFATQADEWVLHIYYVRRGETYFTRDIDVFRKRLDTVAPTPGNMQVIQHLDATRVYYDIQIGLSGKDVWPPQEAIINYFQSRPTDLLYLDNLDVYTLNSKTILKC